MPKLRELGSLDPSDRYLAYLSACTTAVGSLDLLDEPIHLASAFQLAGFQHTIATLWPIQDATAHTIAIRIYQRLAAGVEPALAVHEAVREVRTNPVTGRTPYLWASHIHFGP